ncbi:MAG: hypothetical protein ABL921_17875 [Pirellula sp.]
MPRTASLGTGTSSIAMSRVVTRRFVTRRFVTRRFVAGRYVEHGMLLQRLAACFIGFFICGDCLGLGHDIIDNERSESSSRAEATLQMLANTDLGLARAIRLQRAVESTLKERDYSQAAEIFDRDLRGRKHGSNVQEWILAAVAHSHLGHFDDAFDYLNEAIGRGLELSSMAIDDELTRLGAKQHLGSDPRYAQYLERIEGLRNTWRADLNPSRYGVASPKRELLSELQELSYTMEPSEFARRLSEFNDYPVPTQSNCWVRYEYFGTDKSYPFYVYIPPCYDAQKSTGMIVYLHGELSSKGRGDKTESRTFLSDNPYQDVARSNNLLLLCPVVSNDHNWWEQYGLNALMGELTMVKKIFNVDDNAVWLSGHSKGGTGVFGVAINAPSNFASFYPMNATPIPTRLGNLQHRPIYSTYSSKDAQFPIERMSSLWKAAVNENANWMFREQQGHSHSYSSYIDQELPNMTQHMFSTRRPPLPSRIVWETSLNAMTGCDWLRVERVTPGKNRAAWHDRPAYAVMQPEQDSKADSGRRSWEDVGKIRAFLSGNSINVETSQIGEFSVRLSPQMVDFRYPVKVFLNGKLVREEQLSMDNDIMLNYFDKEADRQRIWCNVLRVNVSSGV